MKNRLNNFYSLDNLGAGAILFPIAICVLILFSVHMPKPPDGSSNAFVLFCVWSLIMIFVGGMSWLTRPGKK